MKKTLTALLLIMSTPILQSCLPLVAAGGVATGAYIGSDPRTAAQIKNDAELFANINSRIDAIVNKAPEFHVSATILKGNVLLTGQVPTKTAYANIEAAVRQEVKRIAKKNQQKEGQVFNEMEVAPPATLAQITTDSGITAKIKTRMAANAFLSTLHITVVTEKNIVYLLGIVNPADEEQAKAEAIKVSGVKEVRTIFIAP